LEEELTMTKRTRTAATTLAVLLLGLTGMPARATMPVIDVAALKQMLVEISYWKQQIGAMQNELNQLQKTHAAMTGDRGMQLLLPTNLVQRNYLPADWAEMLKALDGKSAEYGALSEGVAAAIKARAVLDEARLASLGNAERDSVMRARRSAAAAAITAQRAYANAGKRFEALEGLVAAIGKAPDAKAIADLQGRIAAEEAMLGNEQAKLTTLYQAAQAEQWVQAVELREAAIAGHGKFADRFHPELPE
jgi:type IV secretion system protein VirB5